MPNHQQGQKSRDRHQGGRGEAPRSAETQIPIPKPVHYFKDDRKQVLDPNLVDEKARDWAESFLRGGAELKSTQMRRFYDEIKAIQRKIETGKDLQEQNANFERDRALIIMFKAKALYAEKRKVSPRAFTQFIFDHTASIHDMKDFQAFVKVFEAVVAFHRYFSKEN